MTDIKARLNEAADYLEHLYEGSKHIPTDLIHDRGYRVGWVHEKNEHGDLVAQFHYGGAAEVFMALCPAILPDLARWLREEAAHVHYSNLSNETDQGDVPTENHWDTVRTSLRLADRILKAKETAV